MGNLERKVKALLAQQPCIVQGDRLLIACSGGIDSMALLHFFYDKQALFQIEIAAIHVDHMLRGQQSAEDGLFVEQFCQQHNIPFYRQAIPIQQIVEEEGGNVQTICRRERYAYFETIMPRFTKLVTAHHADDQLETMIMAMTKSTSVQSLSGIRVSRPFSTGAVVRPFLFVSRMEIEQYVEQNDLTFREDPSNAKLIYTRNRIRHRVAPLLYEENDQAALHMAQLSINLQQDEAFLQQMATEAFLQNCTQIAPNQYTFQIDCVQKMPLALQRRFILILLNYLYKDVNMLQSHTLTTVLLKLCDTTDGTAQISLPNGFIARREYNTIVVGEVPNNKLASQLLKQEQWLYTPQYNIGLFRVGTPTNATDTVYYVTLSETEQLVVRPRVDGDRIALLGMSQSKKVSRLFIDEKVPKSHRDTVPLLVSNERGVVAVIGLRVSEHLSQTPQGHEWQVVIKTSTL